MAKTDNPSLAKCHCNGCGGDADIKRKRTGRKLLYLHCKNCGLDQRSGEILQQKWQSIIGGDLIPEHINETAENITKPLSVNTEVSPEKLTLINAKNQEWQPTEKVSENDNIKSEHDSERQNETERVNSGGFSARQWLAAAVGVGLVIARIKQ